MDNALPKMDAYLSQNTHPHRVRAGNSKVFRIPKHEKRPINPSSLQHPKYGDNFPSVSVSPLDSGNVHTGMERSQS